MNSTEILKSALRVFDFLNEIIQEYGVYTFAVLAFLLVLFLVWTLNGGLRRKLLKGNSRIVTACSTASAVSGMKMANCSARSKWKTAPARKRLGMTTGV
jgi:hypothetical protein